MPRSTMCAVRYDRYGPREVLRVGEAPRPEPGRGKILVRVRAAALNPVDAAIRAGALASAVLPGPRVRLLRARATEGRLKRLTGHVERGELRPVLERTYRMDDIAEAHRAVGAGHGRGKRVVLVAEATA